MAMASAAFAGICNVALHASLGCRCHLDIAILHLTHEGFWLRRQNYCDVDSAVWHHWQILTPLGLMKRTGLGVSGPLIDLVLSHASDSASMVR